MTPARIAHYRIASKLGEGGMGSVYRATDTKLGRDVAVKVIPDSFAADPDRMARFTREAQVLASLNHPNIAAIYGVEDRALVMELVEGEELHGPMPVDQALPIIHQLIEALECAHEKGIVHRDLKPANIKVTPDGRVKVLDFGLAKAMSGDIAPADPGNSPTLTIRATQMGMIMGTAAYMAPEQARGHDVDRRADIWSFGVVIYELVTGRRLFEGPSVSDTLASVLKETPDWEPVPRELRRLVRACLVRDARRRMRDIGDARLLIEESGSPPPAAVGMVSAFPYRWLAVGLALTTLALAGLWWRATRPVDRPLIRFSADLGPDALANLRTSAILSPDGTRMAFLTRTGSGPALLATQLLSQSKATVLSGTENAVDPFFSPDGQWIGFFVPGNLKKISVQGGAAVPLCGAGGARGGSWGENGEIIASLDGFRLSRVSAAGGTPQVITKPEEQGDRTQRFPQILPGGQAVIFTAAPAVSAGHENANIKVLSLKTGQMKILHSGGYYGRYLPSGHLVYAHQSTLFAVRFDLTRLESAGAPMPVLDDLTTNPAQGAGLFDFSVNGTFAYRTGTTAARNLPLAWVDSTGVKEPLAGVTGEAIRFSPDGKRLALSSNDDISVYDLERASSIRLTFNPAGFYSFPVWTPDGKHIVYCTRTGILYWIRADGSGQPYELLKDGGIPGSFSPDGRRLAFHKAGTSQGTGRDIWVLPLDLTDPDKPKPGTPEKFVQGQGAQTQPMFSPDGRWLAYSSSESGTSQVFVRRYSQDPNPGGKWQISTSSGWLPLWSRNGNEIFFENAEGHLMVVSYTSRGDTFVSEKPRVWSPAALQMTSILQNLDLHPDGKRFVAVNPRRDSDRSASQNEHTTFLLNFFDELKRKVP